jgi:hypothetical protein
VIHEKITLVKRMVSLIVAQTVDKKYLGTVKNADYIPN